jgi:UDP-glucose 4-epimerase
MSIGRHVDVAQAVARLLDAPSPAHRIYNVVDDEAPDLATLFASVGAPPPEGSNAAAARPFDALLDGRRIREDLGFRPQCPRLATGGAGRAGKSMGREVDGAAHYQTNARVNVLSSCHLGSLSAFSRNK